MTATSESRGKTFLLADRTFSVTWLVAVVCGISVAAIFRVHHDLQVIGFLGVVFSSPIGIAIGAWRYASKNHGSNDRSELWGQIAYYEFLAVSVALGTLLFLWPRWRLEMQQISTVQNLQPQEITMIEIRRIRTLASKRILEPEAVARFALACRDAEGYRGGSPHQVGTTGTQLEVHGKQPLRFVISFRGTSPQGVEYVVGTFWPDGIDGVAGAFKSVQLASWMKKYAAADLPFDR